MAAALAGRIGTIFRRDPAAPPGARQAIGEQWYARAFRAELDPLVFRLPTPPIEQAEIAQAIEDLAAGTHPDRTDPTPGPTVLSPDTDLRRHAALAWKALPDHRRLLWLTQHGLDERVFTRRRDKLPAEALDLLKAEVAEPQAGTRAAARGVSVRLANPAEAAAARFGTSVIRPAGKAEIAASRALFRRGAVAFPPGMLGELPLQAITQALARLKDSTPRSGQTRGLPRQGWWDNKDDLERAVRMRMNLATWKEIGQRLGVTAHRAKYGVLSYGNLDPVFTQDRPTMRRWTPEELATAAILAANGRSLDEVAQLLGRPTGHAIRDALRRADPQRRNPPADGSAVRKGPVGGRHRSLGL